MSRHRAGIIGLGAAVTKHALALRELSDRIQIVGGWSPSKQRRDVFAATYDLPAADTLEAILDDRSLDLVFILTPPWTHLDLVKRCAMAGKHILLEKPIEATLERSEQAVQLCETAGVKLGVVFQNRFRTPYLKLAALLKEGRLGQVLSASLSLRLWRPDQYYAEGDRAMKSRDGGGVLLSQGIHNLDQMIGLIGPVEWACGLHTTSPLRRIDTEDVAVGVLRWGNGAIGTIDATTVAFPGASEQIDLSGEHGSARLERERLRVWLKDDSTIDVSEDTSQPAVAQDYLAHRRLIEDMLDSLDLARSPTVDGRGSLVVHRLVEALLRSGNSGKLERV